MTDSTGTKKNPLTKGSSDPYHCSSAGKIFLKTYDTTDTTIGYNS